MPEEMKRLGGIEKICPWPLRKTHAEKRRSKA
jgi:hypothetical protein